MNQAIVFDLDNTLLECGQYYLNAQASFVQQTHQRTGLPTDLINKVLSHIDVECAALPDGFSRIRFPRSFQAASLALDAIAGLQPSKDFADLMYQLADDVFRAPYPLYPGAREVLDQYLYGGWLLLLVTKGEEDVQNYKIDKNGLRKYFHHIEITLRKSPALLEQLSEEHELDPRRSWVVGDSLRDDVHAGKQAGFNTVEVRTATGRWGYESESHVATHVITEIRQLPTCIPTSVREVAYA